MNTTLAGFSALLSVGLELAKKLGWLPDGLGGRVAVIANALLVAVAVGAGQLGYDLSGLDAIAKTVSDLLLQLLAMGLVSWVTWKGLKETNLSAR